MSVVPHGLYIAAKAVAIPTITRTTNGMNVRRSLKRLPISGVTFADTQPMVVAALSPFFINMVAVRVVKA